MQLTTLFPDADLPSDLDITSIVCDSRHVKQGSLFVAIAGTLVNGEDYIPVAVASGAVAILKQKGATITTSVPVIEVDNIRSALSYIASIFFSGQPEHLVAITGTSGKTSVAHFCQQLWNQLGSKAVSLGTLGVTGIEMEVPWQGMTSPDPLDLHRTLSDLASESVTHGAIETSSIGIDQHRLDHVHWKAGAMTNITHEHLDYHGTFDAYIEAKEKLFSTLLPEGAPAVLHHKMVCFKRFDEVCKARGLPVITYGGRESDFALRESIPVPEGLIVDAEILGQHYQFKIPLYGTFQAENLLCSMALLHATGVPISDIVRAAESIQPVPGRMERVSNQRWLFVDYAHKPDALEKTLKTMRAHITRKLILVFGCGGDRDKGKRPLMGQIARELADIVIITDDNPRFEDAESIRDQIHEACPEALNIEGREAAIAYALSLAGPNDGILVAGKGHENYQIINGQTIPMDDRLLLQQLSA